MGTYQLIANQSQAFVAPEPEIETPDEEASDLPVSDGHIYGNQEPLGKPVRVGELNSYIAQMYKRQKGLEEEFMVSSYKCNFTLCDL